MTLGQATVDQVEKAEREAKTFLAKVGLLHSGGPAAAEWLSHVRLFETPWTVSRQAPLSMRFPRQEYLNELPFPSPGIFPTQGSNPFSFLACGFFTTESRGPTLV